MPPGRLLWRSAGSSDDDKIVAIGYIAQWCRSTLARPPTGRGKEQHWIA
jgi:hypothetical protein